MSHMVFVYGTLKRGKSNHGLLHDATFVCTGKTMDLFHMYCIGFPVLELGDGESGAAYVEGEVYEVSDEQLARLDSLEGTPYLYTREKTVVYSKENDQFFKTFIYVGNDALEYTKPNQWDYEYPKTSGGYYDWTGALQQKGAA